VVIRHEQRPSRRASKNTAWLAQLLALQSRSGSITTVKKELADYNIHLVAEHEISKTACYFPAQ
jgi:hypothetical protein